MSTWNDINCPLDVSVSCHGLGEPKAESCRSLHLGETDPSLLVL